VPRFTTSAIVTDGRVAAWAGRHQRSIALLLTTLVCGGVAATFALPVGLFPQTDFPRVAVNVDAGDRPADQMLIDVTQPIERAIRAVRGVIGVRSKTTRGSAELSVNFAWGSDMAAALQMIEAAVSHALVELPQGTTFIARRMDPTVFPVAAFSLTSRSRSLVEWRRSMSKAARRRSTASRSIPIGWLRWASIWPVSRPPSRPRTSSAS
jgi:multidrug efflux pump subunit AcrB